jgi:2-keto-3-deoxy-L-rhamnonate aldolase RhmA
MRNSNTLAKIRAGQPARVAQLGHFIPGFVAHAANVGYDAIWLDLEHRPMNPREIQAIMPIFHLYYIDCHIRTPTREKSQLYRLLEDGATGLIMPLVEDAETARQIVQAVKVPPLGDRGLEGKGLDGSYGIDTATPETRANYIETMNRETSVIIQLESPGAVRNAEAIAAVEGVDLIFAGPTDFTLREQYLPDDQRMTWEEALEHMVSAAKNTGKAWGAMPRNADHVRNLHRLGAQYIPFSSDINYLINGLKQSAADLDEIYGT